jgi:hypothetical protein
MAPLGAAFANKGCWVQIVYLIIAGILPGLMMVKGWELLLEGFGRSGD